MISVFLKYSMAVYVVTLCAVSNASGDVEGKNKSVACAGCHGENGISLSGEFPNLAGQKKPIYLSSLKTSNEALVKILPCLQWLQCLMIVI